MVEYIAWCCAAAGNQAGTISGKLAVVQYFHRADHGRELLVNFGQACITRSDSCACARGHASSAPLACIMGVSVGRARVGRFLGHRWTGVVVVFGVIVSTSCTLGRGFASASGCVPPVHYLTRDDMALYDGDEELPFGKWHVATRAVGRHSSCCRRCCSGSKHLTGS